MSFFSFFFFSYYTYSYFFFFFFFQAEDGIRDHCVTGVQTCALPICPKQARTPAPQFSSVFICIHLWPIFLRFLLRPLRVFVVPSSYRRLEFPHRSEERRVGKECRSRWSMYY